jgi:hypothetical protein
MYKGPEREKPRRQSMRARLGLVFLILFIGSLPFLLWILWLLTYRVKGGMY